MKFAPIAGVAAGVLAVSQSAHAALPTAVTTGLATAQADMIELYGALTAAGIAVFVVALLYRKFKLR